MTHVTPKPDIAIFWVQYSSLNICQSCRKFWDLFVVCYCGTYPWKRTIHCKRQQRVTVLNVKCKCQPLQDWFEHSLCSGQWVHLLPCSYTCRFMLGAVQWVMQLLNVLSCWCRETHMAVIFKEESSTGHAWLWIRQRYEKEVWERKGEKMGVCTLWAENIVEDQFYDFCTLAYQKTELTFTFVVGLDDFSLHDLWPNPWLLPVWLLTMRS